MDESWLASDRTARWRSASGHGPDDGARASGSSLIEIEPGFKLPLHTDSAEEVIVVIAGRAEVTVDGELAEVGAGELALVPEDVPHEIRNTGEEPLRFAAVYAGTDVVTTYADDVQPDGDRQRSPVKG